MTIARIYFVDKISRAILRTHTHTHTRAHTCTRDACLRKIWERAGGSGHWELRLLREWISGSIACKPTPSSIPLDAFVPLPSWSRLRHPMKTIKIWIICLNVECVNDLYEYNHCIILFVCVLDKDSLRVETSYALAWRTVSCILIKSFHN